MNQKEFEAVIKLPANIRYEYFIKKVADSEEVWGLYGDGWAVTEDDKGNLLIPFWPKKIFAEFCIFEEWSHYKAQSITLNEFMNDWLPGISEDHHKPSIFWNRNDSSVVAVNVLLNDLEQEIEKY
ncbi:DUF2750 domain-containing protein [Paenibacillus sp. LMG 31461]|uniref:DUF2750 domain-containing protein n=1 Tax=Paenibacillus plantarum TaxID=2654975 RepID=A0ABX1X968_9BACL|nr:DUF2750 domain-containing protein [Paenibacillus plantarum]NOU64746.1 DUF2750 domain-containing protein [Paenibacillus plantarum]